MNFLHAQKVGDCVQDPETGTEYICIAIEPYTTLDDRDVPLAVWEAIERHLNMAEVKVMRVAEESEREFIAAFATNIEKED